MKLRYTVLAAAVMAMLLLPALAQGVGDNPLKNAKVGEWIEYKMTNSMMAGMSTKMKQTVVAKDATSVTLRIDTEMMGQKQSTTTKIPLDQPYEPHKIGQPEGVSITLLGTGTETITVGGKSYACTWSKAKVVMAKEKTEMVSKVWVSKDAPLTGVVKSESDMSTSQQGQNFSMKMFMELTGSGK